MNYAVEVSARAERDVQRIVAFLLKRSRQGTSAWVEALANAVAGLAHSADRYPLAPEDADHDEPIRNALFKTRHGRTYRLIFVMRGGKVFVTHVRGPGQTKVSPRDFYPRGAP